jgi:hypothetical protein
MTKPSEKSSEDTEDEDDCDDRLIGKSFRGEKGKGQQR